MLQRDKVEIKSRKNFNRTNIVKNCNIILTKRIKEESQDSRARNEEKTNAALLRHLQNAIWMTVLLDRTKLILLS